MPRHPIRDLLERRHTRRFDSLDHQVGLLKGYLDGYRALLTTQLDVKGFEKALEDLKSRSDPRIRISKRNELAHVYLYFSRLLRGELEAGAEIEGIGQIFFLPLREDDHIGFVSYGALNGDAPGGSAGMLFEFRELGPAETDWRATCQGLEQDAGAVKAFRLEASELDLHFPGLRGALGRLGGPPRGGLLIVRQSVPDTPACLIAMTHRAAGTDGRARFSSEDEQDVAALAQMFFQTYRSVRLAHFAEAYRKLVNDNLILSAQLQGIDATKRRIDALDESPARSFASFLCFLCDSLSRADVIPEMDNAIFFPINSRLYYLYHNVSPPKRQQDAGLPPQARLQVGRLSDDLDALRRIRDLAAGATSEAGSAAPARCRNIFAEALGLLCATASPEVQPKDLRQLLRDVQNRKREFETVLDQRSAGDPPRLVTVVEAALFATVAWSDWGLELLDERFLTFQVAGPPRDGERGSFGDSGALLAVTMLADHLPLGILFINSALAGAFGEEDRRDVQAICRGYLQTFQTLMLTEVVEEYQKLGTRFSLAGLSGDSGTCQALHNQQEATRQALSPEGKDLDRKLRPYFELMFAAFDDLELGAFIAVDRDQMLLYRRGQSRTAQDQPPAVLAWHATLHGELANLAAEQPGLADRWAGQLERVTAADAAGEGGMVAGLDAMRRFYVWALLRSLAPEHEALAQYSLPEVPSLIFGQEQPPGVEDPPQLRSVLATACFEACIFDEDFPLLRRLVWRITGAEAVLRSQTGSVIVLALFYDGLPAGLILLSSSSFLAFKARIEARDAFMATRAFFLPLQMEAREEVIRSYQRVLDEKGGRGRPFVDLVQGFFGAMGEALPSLQAGLFLCLDRDLIMSWSRAREGAVPRLWSTRSLGKFACASAALSQDLDDRLAEFMAGREETACDRQRRQRDVDLLRLYGRRIRDLLQGSRNPKDYDLGRRVEEILEKRTPGAAGRLRSHVHVLVQPRCRFSEAFPFLESLFELREGDAEAPYARETCRRHWQGVGALLAVLVLEEGLPMGIALLASPFEGSFTEHERIDVDRGARALFAEGQVALRDTIICDYRNIVSGMLSEAGTQKHLAHLKSCNEELRETLAGDELASYLAVFMDEMFKTFHDDPPAAILFLPLTERTLYAGLPAAVDRPSDGAVFLGRLRKANVAELALDLPAGAGWPGFVRDWLGDVYGDIQRQQPKRLPADLRDSAGDVILAALQSDTDISLATFLYSGQRYDDRLDDGHRHAYLAPFQGPLSGDGFGLGWRERQAGSLLITALLYDHLPAAGLLVIDSRSTWRFTQQDRIDVESVARAFFLTYRSLRLRGEAAQAARLTGMQDMLLGVSHRLKNDLDPTLGVIDDLKKALASEGPAGAAVKIEELARDKRLEAGEDGIKQVRKRFALLRSVISESAHIRRSRSLQTVADDFRAKVESYKRRLPLRKAWYQTKKIEVHLNELDRPLMARLDVAEERLVGDLAATWIDVSDGFDEILAIYAENAVKAIGDPSSKTDTILLWCLQSGCDPERLDLLFYDQVEIAAEKMEYIQKGEVIPLEQGGGSGTGFFNAKNLLRLNGDGVQRIESGKNIGGTAIWLTVGRLQVQPLAVSSDEVVQDIERWRTTILERAGAAGMEWSRPNRPSPPCRLLLYAGSYLWSEELFATIWQVFAQRAEFLQETGRGETLSPAYQVAVELGPEANGGLSVVFRDNSRRGFTFYSPPGNQQLEAKKRDQFERNYNRPSKGGPKGAVGSLFLAMQERLARHMRIEISLGEREAAIMLKIPPAP
jgi:hypothetical protein